MQPAAAAAGAGKKRSSSEPSLDGERCAAFLPLLPSSVAGFRAKSGAEGKDIDLGEGKSLALLQRGYSKRGRALDLEIVDTRDAKPLRDLFERTRELERDGSAAVIRRLRVQGYDALAQWNDTSRAARVSVLVAGRFLMNLRLRPSDGVGPALELADTLPLAELAKLEPNALVTRRIRR